MGLFKPNVEKMLAKLDIKGLAKACFHEDSDVEEKAIRAIIIIANACEDKVKDGFQIIGLDDVVEALIKIAGKKWVYVEQAIKALGQIGGSRAVQPLLRVLENPREYSQGFRAAEALAAIGEPALQPLVMRLEDKDPEIREKAAYALGQIGGTRVAKPLIDTLKDPDYRVRNRAAGILGEIGDIRALEPLIETFKDTSWVEWSGGAIGSYWHYAAVATGKLGEPAVEALIKVLKTGNRDERRWAIKALEGIRSKNAVMSLIDALADDDFDICIGAAEALGEIRDNRATKALKQSLQSEGKRFHGDWELNSQLNTVVRTALERIEAEV